MESEVNCDEDIIEWLEATSPKLVNKSKYERYRPALEKLGVPYAWKTDKNGKCTLYVSRMTKEEVYNKIPGLKEDNIIFKKGAKNAGCA